MRDLQLNGLGDDNVTKMFEFVINRVQKHCRKMEKCWLPVFFLFPQCFQGAFFPNVVKIQVCLVKG